MKKCPFCKADIEDNARFCLYCMKPLNKKDVISSPQKKQRWWLPMMIALLIIAIAVIIILITRKQQRPSAPTGAQPTTLTPPGATFPKETTGNETTTPDNAQTTIPPQQTQPQEATPPAVTAPDEPTDSEEPAEPEKPVQPIIYIYRAAHIGDDRTGQTVDPENDIVITGVKTPAADGIYHIPSYIDGKRVIAIEPAFNSYMYVKEVYLGETIRNVDSNAFVACYTLEKFYVACDKIFLSRGAFTDVSLRDCTLTIYSSAQCLCLDEISGGYLKNEVSKFRAQWEEWDGSL